MRLTAIIDREGSGYVSLCPDPNIASQGDMAEQARPNLREALDLFFDCASPEEINSRLKGEFYATSGRGRGILSGRQVCTLLGAAHKLLRT